VEQPQHVHAIFFGHLKLDRDRLREEDLLPEPGDAKARLDDGDVALASLLKLNLESLNDAMTVEEEIVALEVLPVVILLIFQVPGGKAESLKWAKAPELVVL
jgi:hypothetical protein